MRFKCGLTTEEEWAKVDAILDAITKGEEVFALLPKTVAKADCRWLEKVKRKVVKVQREGAWGWETIDEIGRFINSPDIDYVRAYARKELHRHMFLYNNRIRFKYSYEAI